MVVGYQNVYAAQLGDIKDVKVKNYETNKEETISVRFKNNLPYVKLEDIYSIISPGNVDVNKKSDGIFEIVTSKGKAVLNTIDDSLYSDNYGDFVELPESESESPIFINDYKTEIIGKLSSRTINFKKYKIDIIEYENMAYFPVNVALDLFLTPGYFDGKIINVYDHTSTVNMLENFEDYDKILSKFFLNDKRTMENIDIFYNEFCFLFDYYYGYPDRSILGTSIKNKGLDYTLENYDKNTKQIKKWLLSADINDYYLGLCALGSYLFDGGHTELTIVIQQHIGYLNSMKLDKKISYIEQFSKRNKTEYNQMNNDMEISDNREKILNNENYVEKGDTALYIFDSFNYDSDGWKNYYKNKGEYPKDTLGGILNALDTASKNKNIKYFVFDVSKNGGGLGVIASIIMDFLGYDNKLQYKNTLNDLIEQNIIDTDINFDGVYDEKDKISKYNFQYGVITSNLTFSTANMFASFAKENNFMILGEQSGGGACSLSLLFTNESLLYSMSSTKCIVNNEGKSIDNGIPVDKNIVGKKESFGSETNDYSKYYDLKYLSSLLNEFYKYNINVKELNDNVFESNLISKSEDIIDLIPISSEEQKIIHNGNDISVFIEVKDISNDISMKEKSLIENSLEDNLKIKSYLDINLFKQIDGKSKVRIKELNGKIKISLKLPEDLKKSNISFNIISVHYGNISKIIPKVYEDNLVFESDKFSTYALAYTYKQETNIDDNNNQQKSPKTGDNIYFYISILLVSLVGIVAVGIIISKLKVK